MPKSSEINVTVRKARKEDMQEVYKLIKELAEFEKLEDQVRITPSLLQEDGFETDGGPAFTSLVAELSDGAVIGYAIFYWAYSTWLGKYVFLEDLYVQPAYRGTGVGKKLFMAVAKIAHETKSKRLDFHVLSWNPATEFYKSLGAINLTTMEKWELFRLDEGCLNKLFG